MEILLPAAPWLDPNSVLHGLRKDVLGWISVSTEVAYMAVEMEASVAGELDGLLLKKVL